MSKLKIMGMRTEFDHYGNEYFMYFVCGEERYKIYPFWNDNFEDELNNYSQEELLDWAKSQVGKFIEYNTLTTLHYYCAKGVVTIKEEK